MFELVTAAKDSLIEIVLVVAAVRIAGAVDVSAVHQRVSVVITQIETDLTRAGALQADTAAKAVAVRTEQLECELLSCAAKSGNDGLLQQWVPNG